MDKESEITAIFYAPRSWEGGAIMRLKPTPDGGVESVGWRNSRWEASNTSVSKINRTMPVATLAEMEKFGVTFNDLADLGENLALVKEYIESLDK